ncbi:MAG: hypothetical protein RLZZ196_1678 [Bacteroidota bacterium]|jgi:hypothetical protein
MATEAQIKITIDSQGAQRSIDTLQKDLVKSRLELDKMIKTFGQNSKEADTMRRSVAGLEVELTQLQKQTQGAVNTNQSLRAELRKITQELQQLEPGSARFQELSVRAGQLRDQIADTNNVVGALSGNFGERLFGGISSVVSLGVAGFQGFQSILALTGVKSEELQETMVRLQALMNLSQVAQTFAGLPDELNKIKAAFGSLTVSTQAQNAAQSATAVSAGATAVAMEGEAVAATGAAASTSVFGAALSALPLVGIVAAIGTIVYGLVQYANSSEDTKKAEEERTKQLEEQKKAQEEVANYIAKETEELTSLIFQLAATNKGSKERKRRIEEINSTYGLTLQNLSDETEFQKQLNGTIKEYIELQYERFLLEKNSEKIAALNEKRRKGEEALAKLLKENEKNFRKAGETITVYSQTLQANTMIQQKADEDLAAYAYRIGGDLYASYRKAKDAISQAIDEQEKLGISSLKLSNNIDEITNGNKKFVKQNTENKNSIINNTEETDKYTKQLEKANNELERQGAIIQTKLDLEKRSNLIPQLKEEQQVRDFYANEQEKIIKRAIQNEIQIQEEKFKELGKTEEDWKKTREDIEKNWTTYALSTETELYNQLEVLRNQELTSISNKYNLQEKIVKNQTEQILANTRFIELEFQKKKDLDDITNAVLTEEQKEKKILEINKKYADAEIQMLKDLQTKKQTQLDLELQQTLSNEEKTATEKEQAQAKYADETIKLAQETADKINEINKGIKDPIPDVKSVEEKSKELYAKISEYVDKISALYNQLSSVIQQQSDYQFSVREFNMNKLYEDEVVKLDESLRKQTISQEQYDAEKDRAKQELKEKEKQLKKDEFETNKRLGIANAFISGAQAVLQALAGSPPPLNFILAGITTGLVGAQIAVIGNQQFQAATGGVVPGRGHGSIDSVPSLLAPGEAIINSTSSSMFPELISSINEAGGGKKLTPDLPPRSNPQQTPSVFSNGNQQNQVVKAYVVETDITDTQKRINRIKQSVEF